MASCSGKGKVTIVDRDEKDDEPKPVAGDGARTVGVIHTEKKPQRLKIVVDGAPSQWTAAVISGNHPL